MKILYLAFIGFVFFGCSTKYDFSLPNRIKSEFVVKFDKQTTRLFVNSQDKSVKFSLFNGLGVALASKIFINNEFKNDKFIMPDSRFERLFACVLQNLDKQNFNCLVKNTNFKVENASK